MGSNHSICMKNHPGEKIDDTTSSESFLIQMPHVVLQEIFKNLDYLSIQILRKTCHDLRNVIDENKLGPSTESLSFRMARNEISLFMHSKQIKYQNHKKGCLISWDYIEKMEEKLLRGDDFVSVFCRDLDIALRYQKETILDFDLDFSDNIGIKDEVMKTKLLAEIQQILKSLSPLLKVSSFAMTIRDQSQLIQLLPYIDSKSLKLLRITNRNEEEKPIRIDKVMQLDQWKQVKTVILHMNYCEPIQHLASFPHVQVCIAELSVDNLILLKESFIHSSTTPLTFSISFKNELNVQRLHEIFGQNFDSINTWKQWCIKLPEDNQTLKIEMYPYNIFFERCVSSDIRGNEIVVN